MDCIKTSRTSKQPFFWIAILCLINSWALVGQTSESDNFLLSISPIIEKNKPINRIIIEKLDLFLRTKNDSATFNACWNAEDFAKYIYPYADLIGVEKSKFGLSFYQPTLMEIQNGATESQKIIKIAYMGHNNSTSENYLKLIYNIIANINGETVVFSKFLPEVTKDWKHLSYKSIDYVISPNKMANNSEMERQVKDLSLVCSFLNCPLIPITYYSCINPKQLFEIKGYDYHPMMYADTVGGMADHGGIVYSGNNSEYYTHEIMHIYTNKLFPSIPKLIDEGMAMLIGGSGNKNYLWHRNQMVDFVGQNEGFRFLDYLDVYQNIKAGSETLIPYMTGALIVEYVLNKFGKEKLFMWCESGKDISILLDEIASSHEEINALLINQLMHNGPIDLLNYAD